MLKYIKKAEALISDWLKDVPHLPKGAQKWIAENIWWITLVCAILSAISVLTGLMAFFAALAAWGTVPYAYGYGIGGFWVVSALLAIVFSAVTAGILAKAITPLKTQKATGWHLLFMLFMVDVIYVVVSALFSYGVIGFIFNLIFGAIGLAISAYLLFEIKSHFVKK